MTDTKNKFQMDTHGEMLTKSEIGILPQQGIARTFQENKPKLLDTVRNDLRMKNQ